MGGLIAILKATTLWVQSAHLGPIANSYFYFLLIFPIGLIVIACQFRPRNDYEMRILMGWLTITLLPTMIFIFCVGAITAFGMTFQ